MCDRFAVIEKGKLIHIENNIVEEKEEDLREVVFTISEVLAAAKVISEKFSKLNILKQDEKMITIEATREDVAKVNRQLNEVGIDVFELNVVKKTLEDRFFEITKQEEVQV